MEKISHPLPVGSSGLELFDSFFDSGKQDHISPFITPNSRSWGRNLTIKSSSLAALFLFLAFLFSFFSVTQPLSNLFVLLTYFFAGIPALISCTYDLLKLELNIDVLMTLAAFLSVLIDCEKEGALLLVLFSFSGAIEDAVSLKAKQAIFSLKKLSPQKAEVVQPDGSLIEKSVRDIPIGTHIHVKAGQIVPLDGKVVQGSSSINLMHLTGESHPIAITQGELAPAGARNLEGSLTLEVSSTFPDSTLSKILNLVLAASESKPKLQRWFEWLLNRYAIFIIIFALLLAAFLPFFFSLSYLGFEGSIYRALGFLIAASPCALIIALPVAYLSALSSSAKQGVLLKGGAIFDKLAKCKVLALDKTGTLTKGELAFIEMTSELDKELTLSLAYSLERSSIHPIAKALTKHAEKEGAKLLPITNFKNVAGYGTTCSYNGIEVFIGSANWILPKLKSKKEAVEKQIARYQEAGLVFTLMLYGEAVSTFSFKDQLRDGVRKTLSSLEKEFGMRLLMLTGDHEKSAKKIAFEAGIIDYYAGLTPQKKMDIISEHDRLIMVGDGINDAPALARAMVGISMGKIGSIAAIDASDIVLLQDNFEKLEWLIRKAKKVSKIVKQNLLIALMAIMFATTAALIGLIPLWMAVILHEGGTVLVGLNALRLLKH